MPSENTYSNSRNSSLRPGVSRPLKLFGLMLAGLLLLVLLFEWMGWPFLRQPLSQLLEKQLERSVRIDAPFKLRLLGGIRVQARGLWISAPAGFSEPHLLSAQGVSLKLRYGDLWGIAPEDPYMIKAINVDHLTAHLVRHENGDSTWQFSKKPKETPRPFPVIQSLVVKQGTANIQDVLSQAKLKLVFSTDEGAQQSQAISRVKLDGVFRAQAMHGQLITQGFLPIASQHASQHADQTMETASISSKGWLNYGKVALRFDGAVYDALGEQKIKGKLHISGPSLGELGDLFNVTLPTTSNFRLDGDLSKDPTGWHVGVYSATVGKSQLSGNFHYDPRPEKASLNGELRGKRFILADLAPAFGTDASQPDSEKVFPDKPLNFTSYNRMNANISIDIDYVDLGKAFREPIAPLKADLNLNKSKLSLAKISAKTATGSLSGTIAIDAHEEQKSGLAATNLKADAKQAPQGSSGKASDTTSDTTSSPEQGQAAKQAHNKPPESAPAVTPAEWQINLQLQDIDLARLLAVSEQRKQAVAAGKVEESHYVSGKLNGRLDLKGQGKSTAQLFSSLNGNVALRVADGKISHLALEAIGVDAAQAIGLLVKGDNNLPMECAVINFEAKQGMAYSKLSLVDTPVTLVLLHGDIKLSQERMNLKLSAYPKNFSPLTARSPILLSGTFKHPEIGIKKTPVAARVLGAIGLSVINPLAAILPFLDPGAHDDMHMRQCQETVQKMRAEAAKAK